MRAQDTPSGYGIVSIALHWITAIVVLVIWFVGSSIRAGEDPESTLRLHTSIALTAYVLLWARIVWRFVKGHPGPMPKQAGVFYTLGKYTHYLMLAAIAAMLVTGPVMVWSLGDAIHVFDWFALPSPLETNMPLHGAMYFVHKWCSRIIIVGTVLHLGGVYKHAAFNQDGTFSKMLVPSADERDAPSAGRAKP
jgi:cytochrome b561